MTTIFLDTRESDNTFIAYLIDSSKAAGYDITLKALDFGDINYQNIYVERKACNDFCSSVCSDRLWEQVYKMGENKDYTSIIIISGGWDKLYKNNLDKIPRLEGAIIQLLAWGIPTIHVKNDEELVDLTLNIFKHSKPIDIPIKRVEKDTQTSLFLALPKVGRKAAKKIRKEYNSMVTLCTIPKDELQALLGPKKGEDVYNALRNI